MSAVAMSLGVLEFGAVLPRSKFDTVPKLADHGLRRLLTLRLNKVESHSPLKLKNSPVSKLGLYCFVQPY
jgi:hypothetical protein